MVGLSGGPAAFNRDTIVDTRWLVGGLPKLTNGAWYQILQMTPFKQELFLQRLFHLHDISTRRAGKASLVRLSPDQFSLECDRMCLQAFHLGANGSNARLFHWRHCAKDPVGHDRRETYLVLLWHAVTHVQTHSFGHKVKGCVSQKAEFEQLFCCHVDLCCTNLIWI